MGKWYISFYQSSWDYKMHLQVLIGFVLWNELLISKYRL